MENKIARQRQGAPTPYRLQQATEPPEATETLHRRDTLMQLIVQYHNGSRLWCLRGWKPNEPADMHSNSGVPSISFGPGLQRAFAEGIMDKGDFIRKIQELGWKVME